MSNHDEPKYVSGDYPPGQIRRSDNPFDVKIYDADIHLKSPEPAERIRLKCRRDDTDLPTRLRGLARKMRESIKELRGLGIEPKSVDLRDLQEDFDDDSRALEEIANELEKEG